MTHKLPPSFLKKGTELAKGSTVYGMPFDSLTRDEAIACAANFANRNAEMTDEYQKRSQIIARIRRR